MAKILFNNLLLSGVSGRLGNFVIRQTTSGAVLTMRSTRTRKFWPNQIRQQQKFARAAAYASAVNRDREQHKIYAADLKPGQSVYQKALTEYLLRPEE